MASRSLQRKCRRNGLAWLPILLVGLTSACVYSPPPLLSYGQTAEALGRGRGSASAEMGLGTHATWGGSDLDTTTKAVGGTRLRLGLTDTLEVGLVGAVGPHSTYLGGPELKLRIVHLADPEKEQSSRFDAAWISGFGVGSSSFPDEGTPAPRYTYLAPYTGLLGSGGIREVQMFLGLRLAASETLGNAKRDLTLYPTLAFGVQLRPTRILTVFVEADLAGAITTVDTGNSAVIIYPNFGLSVAFDRLWESP
jgi:hypothetical protein